MKEEQPTPTIEEFFSKKNTPITQPSPSDLMVIPDVHGDLDALNRSLDAGMQFFSNLGVVPEIIFYHKFRNDEALYQKIYHKFW